MPRIITSSETRRGSSGTKLNGIEPTVQTRRNVRIMPGAMFREAGVGEAEEDEAEDGRGILRGLEAGVGAELIGGGPEAFFEGVVGGVFFRGAIQTMWECFL